MLIEKLGFHDGDYGTEGTKQEARANICITIKNALLLMRCIYEDGSSFKSFLPFWALTMYQNDEEYEDCVDNEDEIRQKKKKNI